MVALLALSAAAALGASDFLGGLASRRAPVTVVVLWSHIAALVALVAVAPFFGGEVTSRVLGVGALAGVAAAVGMTLLYRALSLGAMSVVAPVTATLSAAVPVVIGIAGGDRPGSTVPFGIVLALLATLLVALQWPAPGGAEGAGARSARRPGARGLPAALGAGLALGSYFALLDVAGGGGGVWSLVAAHAALVGLFGSLGVAGVIAAAPPGRDAAAVAVGAGFLLAAANVFYLSALGRGLLSVVSVLTMLYPLSTVLLARCVLGERTAGWQRAGFMCAGVAGLLIVR